jgi:hypothetical protein
MSLQATIRVSVRTFSVFAQAHEVSQRAPAV